MKLAELYEDEQPFNISEEDMERVYKKVVNRELDASEVMDLARELIDEDGYTRNLGSARFLINRMHILIHGIAPYGVSERSAETMFTAPKPLISFIEKKGYDADKNIKHAKEEVKTRRAKVKKDVATKMMADYYKANKKKFTPEQDKKLRAERGNIIKDIMSGTKPADAFTKAAT